MNYRKAEVILCFIAVWTASISLLLSAGMAMSGQRAWEYCGISSLEFDSSMPVSKAENSETRSCAFSVSMPPKFSQSDPGSVLGSIVRQASLAKNSDERKTALAEVAGSLVSLVDIVAGGKDIDPEKTLSRRVLDFSESIVQCFDQAFDGKEFNERFDGISVSCTYSERRFSVRVASGPISFEFSTVTETAA